MENSNQRRTTNRKIYNNWFYACKIVRRLSKNLSILKIINILFCTNNILHFHILLRIVIQPNHYCTLGNAFFMSIVIGKRTTSLKMLFCISSKFWKQRFIQELFIFALEGICHEQLIIDISLTVILQKTVTSFHFDFQSYQIINLQTHVWE